MPSSTYFQARCKAGRIASGSSTYYRVAAERLGHPVIEGVAEVAAGLVALRFGGPTAVEADYA